MTSFKKKAFVLTAVFISFFVYLSSWTILAKVVSDKLILCTGAFICSVFVLMIMIKKLPDEVKEDVVTEGEITSAVHESKSSLFCKTSLSVIIMLAVNFSVSFIFGDTSVPDKENILLRSVTGIFIVPAMEEYLFRHGYLRALTKGNISKYISVILQAALFASLHTGTGIAVAFICGTVLGILYVKTSEKHAFFAVYVSHAIYNCVLYLTLALT